MIEERMLDRGKKCGKLTLPLISVSLSVGYVSAKNSLARCLRDYTLNTTHSHSPIAHSNAYNIAIKSHTCSRVGTHATLYAIPFNKHIFCRLCTVINEHKRPLRTPVELRSVSRQEQVRDSSIHSFRFEITPRI